jgi:hypothetical protein
MIKVRLFGSARNRLTRHLSRWLVFPTIANVQYTKTLKANKLKLSLKISAIILLSIVHEFSKFHIFSLMFCCNKSLFE